MDSRIIPFSVMCKKVFLKVQSFGLLVGHNASRWPGTEIKWIEINIRKSPSSLNNQNLATM